MKEKKMVIKDLFDENFNHLDYLHSYLPIEEKLSYVSKILNNYGNDIFEKNVFNLMSIEINNLKESIYNYETEIEDNYYDDEYVYVLDSPYRSNEYVKILNFFNNNINYLHCKKDLFDLFSSCILSENILETIKKLFKKDILNYEVILSLMDSSDEEFKYLRYFELYEEYLRNDNIPIDDIYIFKFKNDDIFSKFFNCANFLYNGIDINNKISIEKYNTLKKIHNLNNIQFEFYYEEPVLFIENNIAISNSFTLVCEDFLNKNKIDYNYLYKFILENKLKTKNESFNYLANIFLEYNDNDLTNYKFSNEDSIWFLRTEYCGFDNQIKINVDFDNSDIKNIVKYVGIKDFMIGLSYFDFKDKSKVVNNLYSLYSDEINEVNNILIQENDKNLLGKIEKDLKSYLIYEKEDNTIIKQKRKLY